MAQVRWSNHIVDKFIAPEYSRLTEHFAPEVADLPNYRGTYITNSILVGEDRTKGRPLTTIFLRRLDQAVCDYRAGRDALVDFVEQLKNTNNLGPIYFRALSRFESSAINLYLAILAHDKAIQQWGKSAAASFTANDNSEIDRLRRLCNTLKHYDERIEKAANPVASPVWMVPEGLRCADRVNGADQITSLTFAEIIEMFRELEEDAKFVSEGVFVLLLERREAEREQATKAKN